MREKFYYSGPEKPFISINPYKSIHPHLYIDSIGSIQRLKAEIHQTTSELLTVIFGQ